MTVIDSLERLYKGAGFAGDDVPICIIPSKLKDVNVKRWLQDITDPAELRFVLRTFLRHLYLRQLFVSMGERSVIICESVLSTEMWKKALAQVLLVDFEVPSVTFAPRHLLSLYTLGITSALVVHSGQSETLVLPVYENMVLLNAWQALSVAGNAIEENLSRLLIESAQIEVGGTKKALQDSQVSLSRKQLEDIKVRTCFVTRHDRAKLLRAVSLGDGNVGGQSETLNPPPDVKYPVTGDVVLHIPGRVREEACEVMYEHSSGEQTLAHLVLDSIAQCPVDCRRKLAGNIVLIGGNSMLPGFKHRLQQELLELSQQDKYSAAAGFAFHALPVKENYAAWLGGAILGSCGNLDVYALTKADFESNDGNVPDWSNFIPTNADTGLHGSRTI